MTKIRQDAIALLEQIPEDKIIFIIQIMQGLKGLYENDNMKQREKAFQQLERIKKKVTDFNAQKELEEYREKNYNHAGIILIHG